MNDRENDLQSRFDQAAQSWDDKPARVAMAAAIAGAMVETLPLTKQMQVMDFGTGTGLIARALAGKVASVIAADTSSEMLSVLRAKARAAGLTNIEPLSLAAGYESSTATSYDAIVSSMVLHHIEDIPKLVRQLAQWCRSGGWLALADLEPEDGTFHPNAEAVYHHGIDPTWLGSQLEAAGFEIQSVRTVYVVQRPLAGETELRDYPVFLLVARKA